MDRGAKRRQPRLLQASAAATVNQGPSAETNDQSPHADDSNVGLSGLAPGRLADDPALSTPGFRRLTRDSLIYGLGTVSGKAMGLVLLPVLARALSSEDYGTLDVLWSLGTGIAGILLLGLDAAAIRLFFDEPHKDRATLLATWGVMLSATAISAALVLIVAAPWIGRWVAGTTADPSSASVLVLIVPATLTNYFVVTALRAAGRPAAYAAVSTMTFLIYGTSVLALVLAGRASIASIMAAWGVSLVVTSIVGTVFLRSELVHRVRRDAARRLLHYGLPLAPVLAVTLASDFVHRAILLGARDATEVAHLTVALRFASIEALLIGAFQLAWQPRVFAMGTSAFALQRIATDARRFLGLAAAAALALALVMPMAVPIVAGETYRAAVVTVGWCLASALIAAGYAIAATPSAIAKRPGDITRSTVAGIGTSVVANVLLAPSLGSVGTGAALLIGQTVAIVVVSLNSRRALSLPGSWLPNYLLLGLTSVAAIAWTTPALPTWMAFASVAVAILGLVADPTLRASVRLLFGRASI